MFKYILDVYVKNNIEYTASCVVLAVTEYQILAVLLKQ